MDELRRDAGTQLGMHTQIFDAAPDAIVVVDASGVIVLANPQVHRIFGYTRDELIGLSIELLVPGRFRAGHVAHRAGFAAKPGVRPMGMGVELFGLRRDGTEVPIDIMLGKFHDAVLVFIRDVSEKKQAEARLRVAEARLQEARNLESIGRLAGGIAHDFNNALAVIMSTAQSAIGDLPLESSVHADLETVLEAARHAAALTQQLLAFSRRQIVSPRALDVNEVVSHMQGIFRRLVREDVRIDLRLSPKVRCLMADRSQIEQIVMNLVGNASDALGAGGTITIATADVVVEPSSPTTQVGIAPGAYVLLSVADTGAGMDELTQLRIFDPFFSTKGEHGGTGLGLATVYGIVRQSGGSVSVSSEVGQGSVFKVYLPASKDDAGCRPQAVASDVRGTETVLLVEDQVGVRRVAARSLRDFGYVVLEASGGEEALALAAEPSTVIDILLTDVVMPGMSGRTLAEKILASRPTLRVLYMSGHTDDVVLRAAIDAGMPFVQKPFTGDTLAREVRRVLDP